MVCVAAAKHVKKTLAQNDAWIIVKPFANYRVEDNLNPLGRVFYAASTMICVPTSRHTMARPSVPKQGRRSCEMWS